MSARVRTAILGAGWIAQHGYAPHFEAVPALEVVEVIDPDVHRARALAARLGAEFRDPADWSSSDCDALIVCTPPHTHLPILVEALAAGRWVLCEKPVVRTRIEAETILAIGSDRLMGSASVRLRDDVTQLLDWVRAGRLGRLRRVRLEWLRTSGVPAPGSWRTDVASAPWGVLEDLGPHLVDIAVSLLPDDSPRVVDARVECAMGARPRGAAWFVELWPDPEYVVPDVIEARLVASGVEIEIRASWVREGRGDSCRLLVEGAEGAAELRGLFGFSLEREWPEQVCILSRCGADVRAEFEPGPGGQTTAFRRTLTRFAQFCRGAATPVASGAETARAARWLDLIAQAAGAWREAS